MARLGGGGVNKAVRDALAPAVPDVEQVWWGGEGAGALR
jgi:hypothetical protein